MAAGVFHNGADGLVKIGSVTLPVTKWDGTIKGNNKDVSNGRDGRLRIKGVSDAEGSASMHWDSANQPTATTPNIRDGMIVPILLIMDGTTNGFAMMAIIDEVHISNEFEGTNDFDFKYSLAVGSSLTYPT